MPCKAEVLSSQYRRWGHIDWFFKTVLESGYPYFEWSGHVYQVDSKSRKYHETEFIYEDLEG